MPILICKQCGDEFVGQKHTTQFCSKPCAGASKKKQVKKQCAQCGEEFSIKLSHAEMTHCCSKQCSILYRKGKPTVERIKQNCLNCNTEFDVMPHDIGKGKRNPKFCCLDCSAKYKSKLFGYPDINRTCQQCGKPFTVEKPCRKNVFCSNACVGKHTASLSEKHRSNLIPLIKEYRKTHTPKETGEMFGMSASGIQQWGVLGPEAEKRASCPNELTQEQHEFMIGNLLGDGCLSWLQSPDSNSHFVISQKQEFSEYVKALYDIYSPFSCDYYERETKRPSRVNGKINHDEEHWDGTFLKKAVMYTVCHPVFTNYRKEWYEKPFEKWSQKIIPKDIHLTWRIAATWMCDDGSNHCSIEHGHRYLMLHTECFTDSDVEFLIDRLQADLNVKSTLNRHEGKPTIRIGGDDWYDFIENIKKFIPWKCFQYKCINRKKIDKNKSGYIGVLFSKGKWRAFKSFRTNGKFHCVNIGGFDSAEEASAAREEWLANNQNYKVELAKQSFLV